MNVGWVFRILPFSLNLANNPNLSFLDHSEPIFGILRGGRASKVTLAPVEYLHCNFKIISRPKYQFLEQNR